MSDNSSGSPLRFAWLDFSALLATMLALLAMSWRRSAHFLVDFGREVYVPWQLTEGRALYQDLAYFNGPLSPYFNAAMFRVFDVSITTLIVVNTLLLLAVLTLLYVGLGRLGGRLARFCGCLLFLTIFALSDVYQFGNYNFITPYSHEMTHGFLLALVTLFLLARTLDSTQKRWLIGTGVALGLVFLTKAEVFIATVGAVGAGLLLETWRERRPFIDLVKRLGLVGVSATIPAILAFAYLAVSIPATEALRGVIGSWAHVLQGEVTDLRFYKLYLGTLDLPNSLLRITVWTLYYLLAFLPVISIAKRMSPNAKSRVWITAALGLWIALITVLALNTLFPDDLIRPSPLFLAITLLVFLRQDRSDRQILMVIWATFALLLLIKIFFFTRVHHYGFVLAVPAFTVMVLILLSELPRWIDRKGGYGRALQVAALVFFAILAIDVVRISATGYRRNDVQLGSGGDRLVMAEKGTLVVQAIDWLQDNMAPGETLAVFPEGAMLNYQVRRANSTPFFTLLPPELIMFGEENILHAYENQPPDVVAVIKRTTREYGFTAFGEGYAEDLDHWLRSNYQVVYSIVEPEFEPDYSRVFILRRR